MAALKLFILFGLIAIALANNNRCCRCPSTTTGPTQSTPVNPTGSTPTFTPSTGPTQSTPVNPTGSTPTFTPSTGTTVSPTTPTHPTTASSTPTHPTTASSTPTHPTTASSTPTHPTTPSSIPTHPTTASSTPTHPTTVSSCTTTRPTTVSSTTASTTTSSTSTNPSKCQREAGDELLTDVSLLSIVVAGRPTLNRTYAGYKITCTRCYSILNGLQNLLNISVLNGGYQCDRVLLEVNVSLLGLLGRCQVYGRRLRAGESAGCS